MSPSLEQTAITLIGGGLVGATLALVLARALPGLALTLIEARPPARDTDAGIDQNTSAPFDGRSTALAPSSVAVLRDLGIWDELAPYATAIDAIHVSDQGHWGLSQFERQDNGGMPLGYVVENTGFSQVLLRALEANSAIQILAPERVLAIKPQAVGALVQLSNRQILTQLALVCDGADSPLRAQLGIDVFERAYQQQALVANVSYTQPHGGRAFERFTDTGPLALLPLGRSGLACQSALVWTFPEAEREAVLAASEPELLARLQTAFGFRLGRFTHIGRRASYPLRLVVAKEQVRSGLAMMGNAAHFLHPVAGQGFNLALRDGLRLAEVLAGGRALGQALGDLALLQRYEQAQAQDQARTIFLSDSFNRVFTQTAKVWRWGRDLAMLALEFDPRLRGQFIKQLAGNASRRARPWG